MGKIEYFSIVLKKPSGVFFSGEPIVGNVKLRVKENFKVNSIKLHAVGFGNVHWIESAGSGKDSRTSNFSAYEEYLNFSIVFLEKFSNKELILDEGDYSYSFQIELPNQLPSSFEHVFGLIRYSINATISVPWGAEKHATKIITVVNRIDLNLDSSLRQPHGVSGTKVLCCGFCKSDPITTNFYIIKCGFVPGESIAFHISIENNSSREISKMTLSLVQQIRFNTDRKTAVKYRSVSKIAFNSVIKANSVGNWKNATLDIPPVCPTSNGFCKLIRVGYFVAFNYDVKGPSLSNDLTIPCVIGTFPMREDVSISPEFTLEPCIFGACFNHIIVQNKLNGEIAESNTKTYKPFYPYYKYVKLEDQEKEQHQQLNDLNEANN